jgi:hypothetical protein
LVEVVDNPQQVIAVVQVADLVMRNQEEQQLLDKVMQADKELVTMLDLVMEQVEVVEELVLLAAMVLARAIPEAQVVQAYKV